MPDGRRVLVSGYYGFANPGDEAILSVIASQLRARVPDVEISVVSGDPTATEAEHGVAAVLWSDPLAIAEAVRRADLVIVGGGGLFHDYSGFIPDWLLTEGNWGLGFHVTAALLAGLYAKPLMMYGVGVGPLFSEHGRRFTQAACEAANVVTVRDEASRRILQEIGVSVEKIRVTADPGFAFTPAAVTPMEVARPCAAAVLRHWKIGVHPDFWEKEVAHGLDQFLDETGGSVVIVPFQQLPGEQEDDLAVARRVFWAMRHSHTGESRLLEGRRTPAELAGILASCDIVVGMRLHALIFSIIGRRPAVAISYDPKVRAIAAQACRGAGVIELGALTAPLLAARMRETLASWPERKAEVEASAAMLKRKAEEDGELAASLLTSGAPQASRLLQLAPLIERATYALLQAQSRLSKSLERERAAATAQIEELTRASVEQAGELSKQTRELAQAREAHADREAELARMIEEQGAQRQNAATLRANAEAIESRLRLYRSQRAWRVMLVVRKAYTLLATRGWRGRIQFLMWLPGLLMGRAGDLSEYELRFPPNGTE
ncbi:MAG: polysaccharide pyruvyl transferase family protein [Bryobacteraceae bacterium]